MPVPHWADYCSFVISFEIRMCTSSNLVIASKMAWLDSDENCFKFVSQCGDYCQLHNIKSYNSWIWDMSWFRYCSVSFNKVWYLSDCKFWISFVKCIISICLSDAILNGVVFLISFLACSSQLYGSTADFCLLVFVSSNCAEQVY